MSKTESNSTSASTCTGLERIADDTEKRAETLQGLVPPDEEVEVKQEVFKAFANEKRIRILETLQDGEKCVCELKTALDAPQSTVATHLRKLRDAGLVTSRKEGTWRFYRVTDTGVFDLLDIARAMGGDE